MENKLVSPTLERNYRKRYLQSSPDRSLPKNSSFLSHNPGNKSLTPSTYLSRFEKDLIKACRETNSEITKIENKADFFMTELDDRIDFLKSNPGLPKLPADYTPKRVRPETPKKTDLTPPPKLSLLNRSPRLEERPSSIESLMKTSKDLSRKLREETLMKLQKSLGAIKSPCIEDLFVQITRNEHSFMTYKNLRHHPDSDHFAVFNQVCSNGRTPPIPILSKMQNHSLILNRYRISEAIAHALGDAFAVMPFLKKLHLDENSISDKGGSLILKGLTSQKALDSLYYSNNEIGPKFILECRELVRGAPLIEVNFRGCKVVGNALINIFAALRQCKTLKKLNLSEIGLNNAFMEKFCRYIKKSTVHELDLSWNQISQESSLRFFKTLKFNTRLTMIDYSWNNLGSEEGDACFILNQAVMKHPSLMHLNLSFTQLSDNNFISLSPGLQMSKTLVCVHFTGNNLSQKKINTMMIQLIAYKRVGFISDSANRVVHPKEGVELVKDNGSATLHNIKFRDRTGKSLYFHRDNLANIGNSSKYHDRLDGRDHREIIFSRYFGESNVKEMKNWAVSEHCWICERWIPYTIKIHSPSLEKVCEVNEFSWFHQSSFPIKLKCSFNLWEDLPFLNTDLQKYEFTCIFPPGIHRFWIITNNSEVNTSKNFSRKTWEGFRVNEVNIPIRNYDLEPVEEVKDVVQNAFDKNKSVFKNFVEDTEVTRKIMFDNDKKHLKLNRIIKDENALNQVNAVLLKNFEVIKEIFDATSASSSYPNIGWLDFSSFCDRCQLLDNKFLNRAAVDRAFIAVNVDFDDLDDNPQQELCRYEFLEIIVRLAMCKYQDLPLTQAEMTQKMIEEHIFKYADPSLAIKFRREKLYTNEVNNILEANLSNCQELFKKYKERAGRWISLEGYKTMAKKSALNLKDEVVVKVYAFSKMSILDEMSSADAYDRMVFVEFLESLGRLSNALYGESEIGLHEMMDKTLDSIFAKNGLKKKVYEEEKDSSSDSLE
jgi:hypothetical protein